MSVRPVRFQAGGVRVVHEETGHGGVISWAALATGIGPSVTDPAYIRIACPEPTCGAESVHPIGGGADDGEQVQRLFVHLLRRAAGGRTWEQAKALLRNRIAAVEGADRWRLEAATEDGA